MTTAIDQQRVTEHYLGQPLVGLAMEMGTEEPDTTCPSCGFELINGADPELCVACGTWSCGAGICTCQCDTPDYVIVVDDGHGDKEHISNLVGAFAMELS